MLPTLSSPIWDGLHGNQTITLMQFAYPETDLWLMTWKWRLSFNSFEIQTELTTYSYCGIFFQTKSGTYIDLLLIFLWEEKNSHKSYQETHFTAGKLIGFTVFEWRVCQIKHVVTVNSVI